MVFFFSGKLKNCAIFSMTHFIGLDVLIFIGEYSSIRSSFFCIYQQNLVHIFQSEFSRYSSADLFVQREKKVISRKSPFRSKARKRQTTTTQPSYIIHAGALINFYRPTRAESAGKRVEYRWTHERAYICTYIRIYTPTQRPEEISFCFHTYLSEDHRCIRVYNTLVVYIPVIYFD